MPEGECDEVMNHPQVEIDVDALNEAEMEEDLARATSSAPRTPKRNAEQGEQQTPAKVAKQVDPDEEPTNRDLLRFMQQMQAGQEQALRGVQRRIGEAEQRLSTLENATTTTRMDVIEAKLDTLELTEGADAAARSRITQLEKTVAEQMAAVSRRLEDYARTSAASSSSAAAAATASGTRGPLVDGTVVIIGGFPQETPRAPMEKAWAQHLQRDVAANMNIDGMYVEAPFLLSSALQARCSSASQARILVATIRKLQPSFAFQGHTINLYATLQRPKEIREKNKLLLRTAETLQSLLHPTVPKLPPYKCVCWKSSSVVVQDRRICKITRADSGTFSIDFGPSWFDTRTFVNTQQVAEKAIRDQLDDNLRPVE